MADEPDTAAGDADYDDDEQGDEETFGRSPPSPQRADGPPGDPYADSPGASLDSDDPVEPNEPA